MAETLTTTLPTNGNGHAPDQWKDVIAGFDLPEAVKTEMLRAGVESMRLELGELPPEEREPVFKAYRVSEFLQRPKKEWLINGVLGKNDIAMIYGDAGSGKTFVTIDMIISAVLLPHFAGKFVIPRPLKVAYCAGEGLGGLPQRYAAARNRYDAAGGELATRLDQNLIIFADVPQLFDAETTEATIHRFVKEWQQAEAGPLDLLVIDTMHSAIFGADENSAKDTGMVLQAVKFARDELKCTVLLIHHTNKAGKYRGSSAFHGALDSMIETRYDKEIKIGTLECFKQKDDDNFPPLYFRLTPEAASQSAYPEWLDKTTINFGDSSKKSKKELAKDDIIDLLRTEPDLSQTEIVERITTAGRSNIISALKELETEGAVVTTPGAAKNEKRYQLKLFD